MHDLSEGPYSSDLGNQYMDECKRNTDPWQSHPRRMLRHKATIQAARMAFGFALKDPDEAERILEADDVKTPVSMPRLITVESDGENKSENAVGELPIFEDK